MLKKIKYTLVCAVLAMGALACSSDDNLDNLPIDTSGEYKVIVSVTTDASIKEVEVTKTKGKEIAKELNKEFDGNREWSKLYKKANDEVVEVLATGDSDAADAKIVIKIMKGSSVIKEEVSKGLELKVKVIF
ncbi:hypothetical protein [Myroides sp. DW712]|uniref:hypothetical protein n=1 Tax=Myroides sp. DW712 TaxID=3389800 RepID=UPI00397C25A8